MLTKTVDIREAQTNLQDLLSLVREGAEIVLTEGNHPACLLGTDLGVYYSAHARLASGGDLDQRGL